MVYDGLVVWFANASNHTLLVIGRVGMLPAQYVMMA
jgi:hypothetical protein